VVIGHQLPVFEGGDDTDGRAPGSISTGNPQPASNHQGIRWCTHYDICLLIPNGLIQDRICDNSFLQLKASERLPQGISDSFKNSPIKDFCFKRFNDNITAIPFFYKHRSPKYSLRKF
jgi:hypothetical protein